MSELRRQADFSGETEGPGGNSERVAPAMAHVPSPSEKPCGPLQSDYWAEQGYDWYAGL